MNVLRYVVLVCNKHVVAALPRCSQCLYDENNESNLNDFDWILTTNVDLAGAYLAANVRGEGAMQRWVQFGARAQ